MFKKIGGISFNGYMTLEASIIMPWVIFMFSFLIYISFYVYDKCVLYQDSYTVCMRGSIQKEENGAVNYINSHMERQFGEKYFGVDKIRGRAEQRGREVKVYAECCVRHPFSHFMTLPKAEGWQIQTEAKAWQINPARLIRKIRMAENILHQNAF